MVSHYRSPATCQGVDAVNISPHMSLDWDNLETPAQAFARKMPAAGADLQDPQNGERYQAEMSPDEKMGMWVVK